MSAALDINLFVEYFGNCPVIHGKQIDVKLFYIQSASRVN